MKPVIDFLKSPTAAVLVLIVGVFLLLQYGLPLNISLSSIQADKEKFFQASGEGIVYRPPDETRLTFGMEVIEQNAAEAQSKANEKMNALIKSIQDLGVPAENIKTIRYNIRPNYVYDPEGREGPKIRNFTADIALQVRLTDLTKTNPVLDSATQVGVNNVEGLVFGLSDTQREKAEKEARDLAITQAKKKAEEIAAVAGIKLARVVDVFESSFPPPSSLDSGGPEMMKMEKGREGAQVQSGQTEVKIQVTLSYLTF